ncbi:MerR family transcriptional regulator [Limimaricola cinnabarinus]|uniref:MerR family transcriptional regulator n=1 Tax=Limimaricola cinnabarinus TaxID=1125964 RepID=A0A2G1MD27_9RHOB|nr:MerR family DNA-binding transcriptional regulator [Limimaricola cinnabarinus]PHP26631.1 MerR family transcriptional regulator [Limimaricola cinnabarinus]
MSDTPMTFKEMCEHFEVTPRTLRYYEYIELLAPEKQGRARFYGKREVARMTLILRGRRFGFSLEEIRQFLILYETEGTKAQMEVWVDMAQRQIDVLEAQRRELEETISELRKLRDESIASSK